MMSSKRKSLVQVFINDAQVIAYGIQMVVRLSAPFLGILFLCITIREWEKRSVAAP